MGSILDEVSRVNHTVLMNNESTRPPASPKKFRFSGNHVATAAMFLIVLFMWRDLSRTKTAVENSRARSQALDAELANVKSELTMANRQLDQFKKGGPPTAAVAKTEKPARAIAEAIEKPETLFLQEPEARQTEDGIVARFAFEPESAAPLPDRITLVVRVPSASEARILSLVPVAAASDSNLEVVVNGRGNLGMIEGSPAELAALVFEVTVSEPVKATVRGSEGIKAFEMDIRPDGCSVRKL